VANVPIMIDLQSGQQGRSCRPTVSDVERPGLRLTQFTLELRSRDLITMRSLGMRVEEEQIEFAISAGEKLPAAYKLPTAYKMEAVD
jgi:hypothetical protein